MSGPVTRGRNKRSDSAVSASASTAASATKKQKSAAVKPLDDDDDSSQTDSSSKVSIKEHHFGSVDVASDLTIVMDDYPNDRFLVHQIVIITHSKFFQVLLPTLGADKTVHLPAGSKSTVEAMTFLLRVIYQTKGYIKLRSANKFVKPGDTITEDEQDGTVSHTIGLPGGQNVSMLCEYPCDADVVDYDTDEEHDHTFNVSFLDKTKPYVHVPLKELQPQTTLPLLHESTTIEQLLPLTAYIDGKVVLHLIEEHLASAAYYANHDQRMHYLQLASQFKLSRAFRVMVEYANPCAVKRFVRECKSTSSLTKAALEVLVKRLAQ